MAKKRLTILLVLFVFGVGLSLRLYKFDRIPFGLNHDGAQDALQAIDLIQHPWPYRPYLTGGSGETLFKYYLGTLVKIFGATPRTIKFGSTLLSFLTIPLFYLLVKEISERRVALFSAFLLAISGWQIIMGKTVWRAISTPLLEIVTLYFLVRAFKEGRQALFALSGFFLALTLNTYSAARAFCLFVVFLLAIWTGKKIKEKTPWQRLLIHWLFFGGVFLIAVSPLAYYAYHHWGEFNSRFQSLSVFNRIEQEKSLSPLFKNLLTSSLIFNVRANGDDFFTSQPLLDFPTSFLFLFGIIVCLTQIKKPLSFFALSGLLFNLLPGLISIPNGNRNIGTVPFVYLTAGIGFFQLWKIVRSSFKNRWLSITVIVILCLSGVITLYRLYFSPYRRELWGFYPETTVVGDFMKNNLERYEFYLTDNYPRDILTFLTYDGQGNPFVKHYQWFEKKESFLTVKSKKKGIVFIMFDTPENQRFLKRLKQNFPGGQVSELRYVDDKINRSAGLLYIIEGKNEKRP